MQLANILLVLVAIYGAVGIVAALIFVCGALAEVDATTRGGTLGFRILVFPGLVALWPVFLIRWLRGRKHPPEESNAHRSPAIIRAEQHP